MTAERGWKAAALALAVAAVASSLHLGLSASRHREILQRKQRDFEQLQAQAGRWSREETYRAGLDERREWQPVDLETVVARTLGPDRTRITPRTATPIADGWVRREAAVEMREVPFADAMSFLAAAAEAPPPWRLIEIEIRSSPEAGTGDVTAVLEALEKRVRPRAIPWPPSSE